MQHKLLGMGWVLSVVATAMAAPVGTVHSHQSATEPSMLVAAAQEASDPADAQPSGDANTIQSEVISRVPAIDISGQDGTDAVTTPASSAPTASAPEDQEDDASAPQ